MLSPLRKVRVRWFSTILPLTPKDTVFKYNVYINYLSLFYTKRRLWSICWFKVYLLAEDNFSALFLLLYLPQLSQFSSLFIAFIFKILFRNLSLLLLPEEDASSAGEQLASNRVSRRKYNLWQAASGGLHLSFFQRCFNKNIILTCWLLYSILCLWYYRPTHTNMRSYGLIIFYVSFFLFP